MEIERIITSSKNISIHGKLKKLEYAVHPFIRSVSAPAAMTSDSELNRQIVRILTTEQAKQR